MIKNTYGTMYYVNDMKEAVSFYTKTLGVKPSHESPDCTEFSLGEHHLCLHAKNSGQDDFPENGILIMNYDGVKSLHDSMKRDGYNVFGLHQIHPAAWSFHLKDTSGNETSFYGAP